MGFPAEQDRRPRTVIRWDDDGKPARQLGIVSCDAPPYRILAFAGVLGCLSIAAVVTAIQYQRHGSLPLVGSWVEQAQAEASGSGKSDKAISTAAASAVPVRRVKTSPVVPGKAVGAPATVNSADTSPQPTVQVSAAVPSAETTQAVATAPSAAAMPAQAAPSPKEDKNALDKSAAVAPVMARAAPPPASAPPTADARWPSAKSVKTASVDAADDLAGGPDDPLALVTVETPDVAPQPQSAPRRKDTAVAAIDQTAEPGLPKSDIGMTNAKVRSAVFLRSRPSDGGKVLVTVPGGTTVKVASNCKHWCAANYRGQSGFIYKSFLGL